jgi:hypothetical protein
VPAHPLLRRVRATLVLATSLSVFVACASGADPEARTGETSVEGEVHRAGPSPTASRVLLLGDVSLGRGIEPLAARGEALADVRALLADADITAANLESPLTTRAASGTGVRLAADPAVATELTRGGVDLVDVANNHAAEAGAAGLADTLRTIEALGLRSIGAQPAGADPAPTILDRGGVRVAFLAFDVTGQGATDGLLTVTVWDERLARQAVALARAEAEVVVVGLHGGIEMLPTTDPTMRALGTRLAEWGADVVWGHGSHVAQPLTVIDPDQDGRSTLLATSLGNAVFDQAGIADGLALEVLVAADGVVAYRAGRLTQPAGRTRFSGWDAPDGDAVHLARSWWQLVGDRPVDAVRRDAAATAEFAGGEVLDSVVGDVDEDGEDELVVAFRKPGRITPAQAVDPDWEWADDEGRTAHVGRYRLSTLEPLWVASTLARPVRALAACDGAVAVAYGPLDTGPVGTGAWRWESFGFRPAVDLDGAGTPACLDIDGDGRTEPAVLDRPRPHAWRRP